MGCMGGRQPWRPPPRAYRPAPIGALFVGAEATNKTRGSPDARRHRLTAFGSDALVRAGREHLSRERRRVDAHPRAVPRGDCHLGATQRHSVCMSRATRASSS